MHDEPPWVRAGQGCLRGLGLTAPPTPQLPHHFQSSLHAPPDMFLLYPHFIIGLLTFLESHVLLTLH